MQKSKGADNETPATERPERAHLKIFVVRIEDEIVVKRVIHNSTAGWLLQSDNRNKQAWPTRPWPADAQIVGMVRWVARTLT